jgi:hypothetical protein
MNVSYEGEDTALFATDEYLGAKNDVITLVYSNSVNRWLCISKQDNW